MTSDCRQAETGRFLPGRSGNPRGRPKKLRTIDAALVDAANEKVTVHENGRSRRVAKLDVTAKQLVNKSAAGDLRATRMVLDHVQKAEERLGKESAGAVSLSASDQEIAERTFERLTRITLQKLAAGDQMLVDQYEVARAQIAAGRASAGDQSPSAEGKEP